MTPSTATFVTASAVLLALAPSPCRSQQLEPRAYSNVPVGMNFVVAGYAYSQGDVLPDPSIPIKDAHAEIHTAVAGYARGFGLWGRSGLISLAVPYSWVTAAGTVEGAPRSVERSGFADPALRISYNWFGAPALSLREFANYRQRTIVGTSLIVSAPWGRYDPTKVVNIGTNRWAVRPEVGVSHALGPWVFEGSLAVTLFTDNDEYQVNKTRSQNPLLSGQVHVVYNLHPGLWAAVNWTYYAGGRTSVDGVERDDMIQSARWGATLVLPVDRRNSVKMYFNTGLHVRAGSDFTTGGIAWQYRWGAGL